VALHLLVFSTLAHMSHRTSAHLVDHHDALLGAHRHDLTSMLHHDGGGGSGATGGQAAGGTDPGGGGVGRRLLRLLL
jgi:hypothetical protein